MKRLENRGLFWQYPSLNDIPLGPWSRHLTQAQQSRIQCWKLAVDWMADNGVTHFFGVLESPIKAAKQSGCPDWPFHYVCEWTEFPGAQVFPKAMLEHNRQEFRKVFSYMREKGIKPFLHHYNHFAPFDWLIQQPDWVEIRTQADGKAPDRGTTDLTRATCANRPEYRDFMSASWRELFEHLPELEGMLITLGENNYCPCQKCSGGVPRGQKWDHILTPEFVNTMSSYAKHFSDNLYSIGKKPMIRCYHGGGDRALSQAMPKEPTYIIKYSGFNAIDCGPDPIHRFWADAGLDLWTVHEFAGLENASGGMWVNPEHSFNVVRRANEKGRFTGQVAFHNDFWGRFGMAYPGMEVNLEAGLAAFGGEDYDEERWKAYCLDRLGPYGADYLEAGKLISQPVLNIDKIVSGSLDDGLCFGFNYHFTGEMRFPGLIGELGIVGTEPHPWRSNLGPLRRFKEYLLDNQWSEDIYRKALKPGEGDPVSFWDEKVEAALRGLAIVEGLNVPEDSPHLATHELFLTASRWLTEYAKFWQGMIRGKAYYWGANGIRTPIETQRELAGKCIRCLESAVESIFTMKALYYDFPPLYMNWGKAFCGITMEEKLDHYRKELAKVKEEFEPLISGRYYQWPDGVTWTWPAEDEP